MWTTTLLNSRTSYQRQNGDETSMVLLLHSKRDWWKDYSELVSDDTLAQ
jgi:hypothetical protein